MPEGRISANSRQDSEEPVPWLRTLINGINNDEHLAVKLLRELLRDGHETLQHNVDRDAMDVVFILVIRMMEFRGDEVVGLGA